MLCKHINMGKSTAAQTQLLSPTFTPCVITKNNFLLKKKKAKVISASSDHEANVYF